MSDPSPHAIGDPDLNWTEDDAPRSGRFGDVYFSAEDGLAETRAVFLAGCDLPDAWRGRRLFTVGELGFGTGLNVLALLDLWRRERPSDGRLHIFSVEAFPMAREDAARALSRWPELADLTDVMLTRLPPRTPGFHRVDFPEWNATLDLAYLEVGAALDAWDGRADAWFLDGFSPATNPGMWREEVLAKVAQHAAPGARAATFTVASAVRRDLAAHGFTPEKRPGFGRKRERLEATFQGDAPPARTPLKIAAIIGGGIAGASLARALKHLGVTPILIEAHAPGAGASGAPSALVTPRFDAAGNVIAQFFAQAFERATDVYTRENPDAVLAGGVLQLEHQARDATRFDKVAMQNLWAPETVTRCDVTHTSQSLGEPITRGGLYLSQALAIDPDSVLTTWLTDVETIRAEAATIDPVGASWRIVDDKGATVLEADAVFVAAGWGAAKLIADHSLTPVRGQLTHIESVEAPAAFAWGGYVAPARDGLIVGATHDRGDDSVDLRDEDTTRNIESLAQVAPDLAARVSDQTQTSWSAVRAITPDRLPVAGEIATGLFILGGLGARGFTTAPLLAEHLAAMACGAPSPLPLNFGTLVSPARYGS